MSASAIGVAAAGEEAARLYRQYGAKLERFCLRRLRSPAEAEDALQATFLRVYTALRQGTRPRCEAAWLYRIANNVCLDRIEAAKRRARVETLGEAPALERVAAPPGRGEELFGLGAALASMPPNLRQAILLREWQGLSYAEVAERMEVSVSAVETLIFRARRHLAKALVEPGRRVASALDISWVWTALRSSLTTTGMETKLAAGVAALAVGGGGAGLAVAVAPSKAPASPVAMTAPAAPRTHAAATRAVRHVAPRARPTRPAPKTHAAARHVRKAEAAKPLRAQRRHHSTHVAGAPGRTRTLPVAVTPPAAAAPDPVATVAQPVAAPVPRPGTTTVATSTEILPVELPVTVSTPAITVPALPVLPVEPPPVVTEPVTVTTPIVTVTVP